MAELLVQDTSIIATANAIRQKLGKANLIEWVSNKGFADAVASIDVFPTGVNALTSGIYTPTSNVIGKTQLTHDLGAAPNLVVVFLMDEVTDISFSSQICYNKLSATRPTCIVSSDNGYSRPTYSQTTFANDFTANTLTIRADQESLVAGRDYLWIAMIIDGLE